MRYMQAKSGMLLPTLVLSVVPLTVQHSLSNLPVLDYPPKDMPGYTEYRVSLLTLYDNWRARVIASKDTDKYFTNLTGYINHKYGLGEHCLSFYYDEGNYWCQGCTCDDSPDPCPIHSGMFRLTFPYHDGSARYFCRAAITELEMILTVWFKKSFICELTVPDHSSTESDYEYVCIDLRNLPLEVNKEKLARLRY